MLTAAGVQALDNVASSLKTCYGPNGLHALGEGGDGRITFLHNGDQIFALHLNHPLMRFIGQALQCHRHSTGDGSKKIIFMLTSLLKESDLVNSVIPGLIDNPSTRKVWCAVRRSDSKTALKVHLGKILTTSFGSCFSYSVRKRLKELLMELLFPPTSEASLSSHSPIDDLTQLISHYQRCLDTHVVCVEGVSVSQSKVYPGFLLEREFVEPALLPSLGKSSRFKALLLHSDLSLDAGDATISIASRSYLEGTMGHLSKHSVRAVEWMTLNNVRLLLCAAKLSPAAVNLLTQHNITAVQFVDKDLLLSIAEYCETIPYSHTQHLFQCQETSDTGKHFTVDCTTCRYIHVGRRRLIHLEFLRSSEWEGEHSEVSATGCVRSGCPGCLHSIALCAPTASYCRQLAKVVLNSLQVAGRWTQPVLVGGEACLVSVCGGGAWEMALARQLEEHINTNKIQKETALWTVIKALKKGLLQVPLTLVVNASAETERKKNTTHLFCDVGHTHPAMVSPIDGSLIEVGEPELWVAAQPLTMEQDIVLCALSLVGQLLRIDGVIAVKKGILLNKAGQDQQNSDSENEE